MFNYKTEEYVKFITLEDKNGKVLVLNVSSILAFETTSIDEEKICHLHVFTKHNRNFVMVYNSVEEAYKDIKEAFKNVEKNG